VSRLTELSVAKRSITLLLAIALFIAGVSAWGSLKQELLPDIDFPVITVIAPFIRSILTGKLMKPRDSCPPLKRVLPRNWKL